MGAYVGEIIIIFLVVVLLIGWVFGDYVISRRVGIGPIDLMRLIIRRIKKSR